MKPVFSKDGNYILFSIQPQQPLNAKKQTASVDVWSYLDTELQSVQLERANYPKTLSCVFGIRIQRLYILGENEIILGIEKEWLLVKKEHEFEAYSNQIWNLTAQPSYILISLKSKSAQNLKGKYC